MYGSRDLKEISSEQRIMVFECQEPRLVKHPFVSYGGKEVVESEWFKNIMGGIEEQGAEVNWKNAWGDFKEENLDRMEQALKVTGRKHSGNLNSKR